MRRVYLDVCSLCRPFDDHRFDAVRIEAEAVAIILRKFDRREWLWVASDVVTYELEATPRQKQRQQLLQMVARANDWATITVAIERRAAQIEELGFKGLDALHLAAAESASVDVFVTTDKRLLRAASRSAADLCIRVANPVSLVLETKKNGA